MPDYRTIELGKKYIDTISGFEGIATSYYTYLNGCVRVELSGKAKPDGDKLPAFVFDIDQVVLVEEATPDQPAPGKTGGPRDHKPVAR